MDGQGSPIWKVTFKQSWKLVRKVAVQISVEECSGGVGGGGAVGRWGWIVLRGGGGG